MKISKTYSATIIGGIFTIVSLLLTITFIVPIFTVAVGAIIEGIFANFMDTDPYSNIGRATLITLLVLLILAIAIVLLRAYKKPLSNGHIIGFMIAAYFLLHTLGFYIYWAVKMNYRSDGQLLFGAVETFPVTSFGFVILGLLIDVVRMGAPQPNGNQQLTQQK